MNRIAIIEDNAVFAEMLKKEILKYQPTWMMYCFQQESDYELYDAYFLDIELHGKISGFEIAEKIRASNADAPIIFISSHEELICEGYKYKALRFLRKSRYEAEMEEAVTAIKRELDAQMKTIEVIDQWRQRVRLYYKHIQYVYSEGNYLHLIDFQQQEYRYRGSIKQFQEEHPSGFVLASAGMLINPRYITQINKTDAYVYIGGIHKVMVSRRNLIQIMKCYTSKK